MQRRPRDRDSDSKRFETERNHDTGKKEEIEKYVERGCYSETFEADGILDTAKKDKGREKDCYRLKENKLEEENFDREKR